MNSGNDSIALGQHYTAGSGRSKHFDALQARFRDEILKNDKPSLFEEFDCLCGNPPDDVVISVTIPPLPMSWSIISHTEKYFMLRTGAQNKILRPVSWVLRKLFRLRMDFYYKSKESIVISHPEHC